MWGRASLFLAYNTKTFIFVIVPCKYWFFVFVVWVFGYPVVYLQPTGSLNWLVWCLIEFVFLNGIRKYLFLWKQLNMTSFKWDDEKLDLYLWFFNLISMIIVLLRLWTITMDVEDSFWLYSYVWYTQMWAYSTSTAVSRKWKICCFSPGFCKNGTVALQLCKIIMTMLFSTLMLSPLMHKLRCQLSF